MCSHTLIRRHSQLTSSSQHMWTGKAQALSLDTRRRRERRGEKREAERGRREEERYVLTPFLEPSLSNDGDIAHGSFTPSLMPLHACSTERERGRRGGEEERRKRGRGRGGSALPASASLSLPSFPVLPLTRSLTQSLSLRRTHAQCVCVRVSLCFLSWLISLPPFFSSSSSLVLSPDLPPHRQ